MYDLGACKKDYKRLISRELTDKINYVSKIMKWLNVTKIYERINCMYFVHVHYKTNILLKDFRYHYY